MRTLDPRAVARALGGQVAGRDTVLGPGHSAHDRPLSVKLNASRKPFPGPVPVARRTEKTIHFRSVCIHCGGPGTWRTACLTKRADLWREGSENSPRAMLAIGDPAGATSTSGFFGGAP